MEVVEKNFSEIWDSIVEFFNYEFFELGGSTITPKIIGVIILSSIFVLIISNWIAFLVGKKILKRYNFEVGLRNSIATLVRYVVLVIGFLIIIQSSGIDLSSLNVLAGALGVGIGFGLQNITNNFISGIIILFERPIKVGDRIEVAGVKGQVFQINARSTTVNTNDNITVIVPNSEFINGTVINWSHNDSRIRFHFPVGVSYNEDPEQVRELLIEVAKKHEGVLDNPSPQVLFTDFGDSSLDFELLVWTEQFTLRPSVLQSDLYFAIFKEFKKHNIEIPFPQRDLHLRSSVDFPVKSVVEKKENKIDTTPKEEKE
ncbi:MAG: mechanosensitive ion channel [Cyclobacteriaceae bacterium]|nr:mechanosensitive ion channel family protein [Cyclobacteriaceae bacterium]MCH8517084.1 mechanosensitive ion channel [Cyclobacteriaceae bacterium]